jgi:hypothetical protein
MESKEYQIKISRLHELEKLILQKMPEWTKANDYYLSTEDDSQEEEKAFDEFNEIDIEVRNLQWEYHDICSELGLIEDD